MPNDSPSAIPAVSLNLLFTYCHSMTMTTYPSQDTAQGSCTHQSRSEQGSGCTSTRKKPIWKTILASRAPRFDAWVSCSPVLRRRDIISDTIASCAFRVRSKPSLLLLLLPLYPPRFPRLPPLLLPPLNLLPSQLSQPRGSHVAQPSAEPPGDSTLCSYPDFPREVPARGRLSRTTPRGVSRSARNASGSGHGDHHLNRSSAAFGTSQTKGRCEAPSTNA